MFIINISNAITSISSYFLVILLILRGYYVATMGKWYSRYLVDNSAVSRFFALDIKKFSSDHRNRRGSSRLLGRCSKTGLENGALIIFKFQTFSESLAFDLIQIRKYRPFSAGIFFLCKTVIGFLDRYLFLFVSLPLHSMPVRVQWFAFRRPRLFPEQEGKL